MTQEIRIDVGQLERMWESLLDVVENEKARVLITRNRRAIALVVPADVKMMSDQDWQQAKAERRERVRRTRGQLQDAWVGDRPPAEEIVELIREGWEESYLRIERAIEESRRERLQSQEDPQ
jgi:PHD/YefM family antitoxin component YafN of YafNO toxin-antitoxin module